MALLATLVSRDLLLLGIPNLSNKVCPFPPEQLIALQTTNRSDSDNNHENSVNMLDFDVLITQSSVPKLGYLYTVKSRDLL